MNPSRNYLNRCLISKVELRHSFWDKLRQVEVENQIICRNKWVSLYITNLPSVSIRPTSSGEANNLPECLSGRRLPLWVHLTDIKWQSNAEWSDWTGNKIFENTIFDENVAWISQPDAGFVVHVLLIGTNLGCFHIGRPHWEGRVPKNRWNEQNQLIYVRVRDKREGVQKSEKFADVVYGSPLKRNDTSNISQDLPRKQPPQSPKRILLGETKDTLHSSSPHQMALLQSAVHCAAPAGRRVGGN